MDILKLLRQITEGQDTIPVKLDKIMTMIVREMQADAGAVYLVVDDNYLELFGKEDNQFDRVFHAQRK